MKCSNLIKSIEFFFPSLSKNFSPLSTPFTLSSLIFKEVMILSQFRMIFANVFVLFYLSINVNVNPSSDSKVGPDPTKEILIFVLCSSLKSFCHYSFVLTFSILF